GLVVACVLPLYLAYLFFHPYNEVTAALQNVPPDTEGLCLLADTSDGPVALRWSLHKLIPFSMHPAKAGLHRLEPGEGRCEFRVRGGSWRRVGVVRGVPSGGWRVAWFGPPKTGPAGRSWLLGGGTWVADLDDADEEEPFPKERLRVAGLAGLTGKE